MKVFVAVVLAALAAGQQFQNSQNYSPAVWIAGSGYFQQGGRGSFGTSSNNNQFQSESLQNNNNYQRQGANFRSGSFSDSSRQLGSFQGQNQLQFDYANNRNQFQQDRSFQNSNRYQNTQGGSSQLSSDNQNRFQFRPNSQNRFQFNQENNSDKFQSRNFQSTNQNNLQSRDFSVNNQNRNQPRFSQQEQNRFQSGIFSQNQNRFQDSSFQQNRFQQNQFQQQDNQNRFRSSNQNQFNSRNFQFNNQNSQRDQAQFRSGSFSNDYKGAFEPLNLPSGASYVLGDISTSFTCANRPYGYYADQDNSCRVFHVCNPSLFSDGEIQTYQYSFMCGEGTVFDQKELTCVKEYEASPCQQASSYYFRNEDFGRPEEKF